MKVEFRFNSENSIVLTPEVARESQLVGLALEGVKTLEVKMGADKSVVLKPVPPFRLEIPVETPIPVHTSSDPYDDIPF